MTETQRAERLLEIAQAAHRLSVCHETIRRWIHSGKLAAVKTPGGHWRVSQASVDTLATTTNTNKPLQRVS